MEQPNFVVTIGRQFGSGGCEIGRLVAERLGIAFYDKELLARAARHAGVSREFFERSDEKSPSFLSSLFSFSMGYTPYTLFTGSANFSDDMLYRAQSEIIQAVAQKHSCVIVGRSADYVLRHHPRCVNVFIHAPVEECVKRIMGRGEASSADQARVLAEKTNKLRAGFYNFYSDRTWGDAATYHLSIDSSSMPVEQVAELICHYVASRFDL